MEDDQNRKVQYFSTITSSKLHQVDISVNKKRTFMQGKIKEEKVDKLSLDLSFLNDLISSNIILLFFKFLSNHKKDKSLQILLFIKMF